MAVWQVDFHVIPRRALAGGDSRMPPSVLETTDWWSNATLPADYRSRLTALAPPVAVADRDLEIWGSEDGNRVEVQSGNGRVRRVRAKVDVRHLDSKFGAAFINFARKVDTVLVRSDGLVVEPTITAYAGALRTSEAWRYSNDPMTYLARQAADDDTDE